MKTNDSKSKKREKKTNKPKKYFLRLFPSESREKISKQDLVRIYSFEIILVLIVIFLISLMYPRGKSYQFGGLTEGEVYVGDKIIAPFTFAINKTDEDYKKDIREAREAIPPVFVRADSICDQQQDEMDSFFQDIGEIIMQDIDNRLMTNQLIDLFKNYNIDPDENIIQYFLDQSYQLKDKNSKENNLKSFKDSLVRILRDFCGIGILNRNIDEIYTQKGTISVLSGNEEVVEEINYFHDEKDVKSIAIEKLRSSFEGDELSMNVGYQIFMNFLVPNIIYDKLETDSRRQDAESNVPRARGTVLENEKIIDTYEKITKEHLAKLNSLAIEKAVREEGTNIIYSILRYLGKLLMSALGLSVLLIFLVYNRWRLLRNIKKVILIAVIFLLVPLLSFVISKFTQSPYLVPITIGAMLLTIFYDTRVGFVGTVSLSIVLAGMMGNDFNVMLVSIVTGTVAILSVAKVRSRSWFFKSILLISSAYLISITTLEILRYTNFSILLKYWLYGIINGFLSPLLAYGLQVVFEYVFDMLTDLRLLELSDLNRPLLRRLAVKAPGTYHHCIMVGSLAEAASEHIGANALLARVGAYYHDIGKIEKPEYFIENIKKTKNPHEKLSPSMSCLILTNHVRRGVDIAKKYGLPREIQHFISEHHGTNVMTFFYKKALEQNRDSDIDISTFRYPGPKPHTKETGIVMLADGVEAASRTLKDPSASRIKGLVTSIVNERFKEFELDDCPLTLKDLNKIIESFQNILLGTFHGRVEYPDQEERFFPKSNGKEKNSEIRDYY